MAQNIYDTASFFEEYSRYPRAVHGIRGASEWPLLKPMLPVDLTSMDILDLGCGDGWFCRWAAENGAVKVHGLDVSRNMLDHAMRLSDTSGPHSAITFQQADLETITLNSDTYDVAFSGLALHYVGELKGLLKRVHASLRPGGLFVFSVEHPIFTAPLRPGFSIEAAASKTTTTKTIGGPTWLLSHYFAEGQRTVTWLGAEVRKHHHTFAGYFKALQSAGFAVEAVDEWGATEEEGRMHPDWPNEGVIPRFLLVSARKAAH